MKIKNVIASSILLIVVSFSSFAGCKRTNVPVPDVDGGSGGAGTVTSVSSTSSGSVDTKPCVDSCPTTLPTEGDSCDVVRDQYCEYAGSVCKIANCNSVSGVWEVVQLDPCLCYPGPASTVTRE